MDRSERIRRCIGNCERSLSTQLPFAYVHLIVFVVMLNNTVLSIVAGLFCAAALKNGAVFAVSAEVLYSITITLVYQVDALPSEGGQAAFSPGRSWVGKGVKCHTRGKRGDKKISKNVFFVECHASHSRETRKT